MSQFAGRAALVTGAGSGIGAACAIALAGYGAMVWCTDVTEDGAAATVQRISEAGGRAAALTLDVTDEGAWEAATAAAGALDIIVHAAGVSAGSPITDTAFADWKRVMAVNLDGSFLAMKHGVRALRERGGSITAIASASGVKAAPGAAAYSSSKAAVRMLARVVAKECLAGGTPVRVNTISPAGVRTPMWSSMPFFQELSARLGSDDAAYREIGSQPGSSRFASPEQIAAAACFLASDDAAMITGTDLVIDDGYTI